MGVIAVLVELPRGWLPNDDGMAAASAARVLDGQRPHVDFQYVYTGLQPFLDAAGMSALGETLLVPRVLLVGFASCVWALFAGALTREGVPLSVALLITVPMPLALAINPSANATWYVVHVAIVAASFLCIRPVPENRGWFWLGVGGLLGIGALFKANAVLFSLAIGVAVLLQTDRQWIRIGSGLGSVALFGGLLAGFSRDAIEWLPFLMLPTAVIFLSLVWRAPLKPISPGDGVRIVGWLLAGFTAVAAAGVFGIVGIGRIRVWTDQALLVPAQIAEISFPALPPLEYLAFALFPSALHVLRARIDRAWRFILGAGWFLVAGAAAVGTRGFIVASMIGWLVMAAALHFAMACPPDFRYRATALVLCCGGWLAYPSVNFYYLLYLTPLLALGFGVLAYRRTGAIPSHGIGYPTVRGLALGLSALLLMVMTVKPAGAIPTLLSSRVESTGTLEGRGGDIHLPDWDSDYVRLMEDVKTHQLSVDRQVTMVAVPDSPEIQFLLDRHDPRGIMFDGLRVHDEATMIRAVVASRPQLVVLRSQGVLLEISQIGVEELAKTYEPITEIGRFSLWQRRSHSDRVPLPLADRL